jgi:hypothetical protein
MLTSHRIVLTPVHYPDPELPDEPTAPTDTLFFWADDPDIPHYENTSLYLTLREWWDMGSPRTITVTVEPGDLLNPVQP